MRRYLEAGFPERIWSEEKHRTSMRGRWKFVPSPGDEYFAFTISHLIPAFVILIVGSVLSSVVFIAELIVKCYVVGPCHHGMARPQVADRGTASDKEGSCE